MDKLILTCLLAAGVLFMSVGMSMAIGDGCGFTIAVMIFMSIVSWALACVVINRREGDF